MRAAYAEPSHAAVQGGAIDAEPACGFGYIALAGQKHCPEVGLMAVFAEDRGHSRQLVRQIRHLDQTVVTQRCGKGNEAVLRECRTKVQPAMREPGRTGIEGVRT